MRKIICGTYISDLGTYEIVQSFKPDNEFHRNIINAYLANAEYDIRIDKSGCGMMNKQFIAVGSKGWTSVVLIERHDGVFNLILMETRLYLAWLERQPKTKGMKAAEDATFSLPMF